MIAIMIAIVVWIASDNTGEGGRIVFNNTVKQAVNDVQNSMLRPHYQGVDSKNQPFTVTADKATQIDSQTVGLDNVSADLSMGGDSWLALNAGRGKIDLTTKKLQLSNGVQLYYDGGYEFRTDYADVDMEAGTATGNAPVQGQGPAGTLVADSFSVLERGQIIRFNGNVKMTLYRQ